jgi:hypothetical protein
MAPTAERRVASKGVWSSVATTCAFLLFFGTPIAAQEGVYWLVGRWLGLGPRQALGLALWRGLFGIPLFVLAAIVVNDAVIEPLALSAPVAWGLTACFDPLRSGRRIVTFTLLGSAASLAVNLLVFQRLLFGGFSQFLPFGGT